MTQEEVQTETQKDATMKKLAKAIQTGQWSKEEELADYAKIKNELSIACGVILRDHRLVIPESLRQKVVDISHASHQGVTD